MVFEIVQASTTPSEDLPCQRKLVESKERRACWYSLPQKMSWRTINVIRLSKAPGGAFKFEDGWNAQYFREPESETGDEEYENEDEALR